MREKYSRHITLESQRNGEEIQIPSTLEAAYMEFSSDAIYVKDKKSQIQACKQIVLQFT